MGVIDSTIYIAGFDDALLGKARQGENLELVAYSYDTMVELVSLREGVGYDEACDIVDLEVIDTFDGAGSPVIVYDDHHRKEETDGDNNR